MSDPESARKKKRLAVQDCEEVCALENVTLSDVDREFMQNFPRANFDDAKFIHLVQLHREFADELRIVPETSSRKTSEVWKHFGQLEFKGKPVPVGAPKDKKHFCIRCWEDGGIKKLFWYGSSSATSNFSSHLRNTHNIMGTATENGTTACVNIFAAAAQAGAQNRSKLAQAEANRQNKKLLLTRQLALMCALDGAPFSIVESKGFKMFCDLNNISNLPTASAVSGAGLRDIYLCAEAHVKKIVAGANVPKFVAISFDCATDRYVKRGYINLKLHYLDTKDYTNKVVNLATIDLPRPHTGDNIAKIVRTNLNKFGLLTKTIVAVTDGGSNVKLACRLLEVERHGCILHSIHLLISVDLLKDPALKPITLLLAKLKTIFRTLTYKYERLSDIHEQRRTQENLEKIAEVVIRVNTVLEQDEQIGEGSEPEEPLVVELERDSYKTIKNSVSTRWGSNLVMSRSYVGNKETINTALSETDSYDLFITTNEEEMLVELIEMLEVFEASTIFLQGSSYPTANLCILFRDKIEKSLTEKRATACFEVVIKGYDILLAALTTRFVITDEMVIAGLLDPIQKDLSIFERYLDGRTRQEFFVNKLRQCRLTVLPEDTDEEGQLDESNMTGAQKARLAHVRDLKKQVLTQHHVDQEVAAYFGAQVPDAVECLEFWRKNSSTYPRLSQLVPKYLCCPASSAMSECGFSTMGRIITERRTRLVPGHVNQLCFVQENFALVQEVIACDLS